MSTNLNTNINGARRGLPYPTVLLDGNTVAWYDSQLLSTITKDSNDLVSVWKDRLLSGKDLNQAVESNQPKWVLNDGILFNGTSNFLKTSQFSINQPEFVYIVFKQITWTINRYIYDGYTNLYGMAIQRTATPGVAAFAGAYSTINNNLPLNTFGIMRVLYNGASSKIQINETTAITGNFGANNPDGLTLGASGVNTSFSNIQVKEIIIRKVADSVENEAIIYNYLKKKI